MRAVFEDIRGSVRFGVKSQLFAVFFLISLIFVIVNWLGYDYSGVAYFHPSSFWFVPVFAVTSVLAWMVRFESPRVALFFFVLGLLYVFTLLFQFATYAAQFTPFHLDDWFFYRIDQWFGFNSIAIFRFSQDHLIVKLVSHLVYDSLNYQMLCIPLILALLLERRQIDVFFTACLVSGIVGYVIYYFFPTTDPANVIHTVRFLQSEYQVIVQFHGIHNYQKIVGIAPLIGFPSFHVIWAMILAYVCKNRKWLFYPILLLNILLIISTLTSGWHFLISVLGGFIIAVGSLYLAERWSGGQVFD